MTISATVLADSINRNNRRVTTFLVSFPRIILPEFNTHRVFSKNTSSSRAIPIEKLIQQTLDNPFIPVHFGKNQKGMSANEELTGEQLIAAKLAWLRARDRAVESARELQALDLHKQIVNRTLECYLYTKMIVTATEYDNFFELRCHPDAQPEIQALAVSMRDAMNASTPKIKTPDKAEWSNWHLPLVSEEELADTSEINQFRNLVRSVARCARTSYDKVSGGESDFSNDFRIFRQLGESVPKHMSPFEHQAFPAFDAKPYYNLVGWESFRYQLDQNSKWFKMIVDKVNK
jgi:thymidylate synthase ThyX